MCCSAGAGRTGTFIALSNILERVKAEGLLDVFQTVKSLRMQRPHMVQTVVGALLPCVLYQVAQAQPGSQVDVGCIAITQISPSLWPYLVNYWALILRNQNYETDSHDVLLMFLYRNSMTSATEWYRILSTSSQTMPISNEKLSALNSCSVLFLISGGEEFVPCHWIKLSSILLCTCPHCN